MLRNVLTSQLCRIVVALCLFALLNNVHALENEKFEREVNRLVILHYDLPAFVGNLFESMSKDSQIEDSKLKEKLLVHFGEIYAGSQLASYKHWLGQVSINGHLFEDLLQDLRVTGAIKLVNIENKLPVSLFTYRINNIKVVRIYDEFEDTNNIVSDFKVRNFSQSELTRNIQQSRNPDLVEMEINAIYLDTFFISQLNGEIRITDFDRKIESSNIQLFTH